MLARVIRALQPAHVGAGYTGAPLLHWARARRIRGLGLGGANGCAIGQGKQAVAPRCNSTRRANFTAKAAQPKWVGGAFKVHKAHLARATMGSYKRLNGCSARPRTRRYPKRRVGLANRIWQRVGGRHASNRAGYGGVFC